MSLRHEPIDFRKITSTHSVLILEKQGGLWAPFLKGYFNDTLVLTVVIEEPSQAAAVFDRSLPRVLFVEPSFLNKTLLQKIKVRKNTDPTFCCYLLGEHPVFRKEPFFNATFSADPASADFNKKFVETLPMPELIKILVIDDEEEIGTMVRDYFEGRKAPAFEIECASHGKEAFEVIKRKRPDVILLDIKMPVMDGREFYTKARVSHPEIPVIVFFDSISGEELSEMRKSGNPAVVEKGYKGSSLSAMMSLVKKLVYFST
jgi:CheY-like chemotaxis protein